MNPAPAADCPKHMVFGPCGGVRPGGGCEMDEHPCPFVEADLVRWPGTAVPPIGGRPGGLIHALRRGRAVITDLRVRPLDLRSVDVVARILGPGCDAVLVGDHQSRPDLPPSVMARAVMDAGAVPWITLTCRDRNRVVLESELAALAALGVEGVHCVTGDARAPSVRTDASQVFDLDGVRLGSLARTAGLAVSVAATPVAPPLDLRPRRVVEKERAGAQVCFINHAGGPGPVGSFVAAAQAAGSTLSFIACVAVFTDPASAAVLAGFPGLQLEQGEVAQVLGAADPVQAGIDAAVAQAEAMLSIDGVEGVNLSGSATGGPEEESAAIMATIASRITHR